MSGSPFPVCNLLACYLELNHAHSQAALWVAIGLTVTAVLLLAGRERLNTMARQLELPEIVTASRVSHLCPWYPSAAAQHVDHPADESAPYGAWLAFDNGVPLSYENLL